MKKNIIDKVLSEYDYVYHLKEDKEKFEKYLSLIDDDNISLVVDNYITCQNYESKLKIINRYIDKVLSNDINKINKIIAIDRFITKISKEDEVDNVLYSIVNNANLKVLLHSFVKNNIIDLTNIKKYTDSLNVYLIFEFFAEENDYDMKYDDLSEISENDIIKLYLKDVSNFKRLTMEEEQDLLIKIKNGDKKAREKFLSANLRLVVSIAARFYSIYKNFDFLDFVQEGNMAMMRALDNFDMGLNSKFSTYATKCIDNTLRRYVSNSNRNIRYPYYVNDDLKKVNKLDCKFYMEYGRKPSDVELSYLMNCKESYVKMLRGLNTVEVSLNAKLRNSKNSEEMDELINIVEDSRENVENLVENDICYEDILRIIYDSGLFKRDIEIFLSYNGFGKENIEGLREVGKKYHISGERVRQIDIKVRRILAKNPKLRYYYDGSVLVDRKERQEFFEEKDYDKFDFNKNVTFKNGDSMSKWFYKNRSKILLSDAEIDKGIVEQYKLYIKNLSEQIKKKLNYVK